MGRNKPFALRMYVPTVLLNATYVPDIHAAAHRHPAADLELPPTCLLGYGREVVPKRFDLLTSYGVHARHPPSSQWHADFRGDVDHEDHRA